MENESENLVGRKIFFLNPWIELEKVLTSLRSREYEVYPIAELRQAKNILRANPNSILYINVSTYLNMDEWYNFIKSFKEDKILKTISLGLISKRLRNENLERFTNQLQFDAGLFEITYSNEELIKSIVAASDKIGAKGVRKYVRANCLNDDACKIHFFKNGAEFEFKVVDISSACQAVIVPPMYAQIFSVGEVIQDAELKLNQETCKVNLCISALKQQNNLIVAIQMFTPETPAESLDAVRKYVSDRLYTNLMEKVKGMPADDGIYS